MAHHQALNPAVAARLRTIRARATLYSVSVAMLLCAILFLSLYLLFLSVLETAPPEIIAYHAPVNQETIHKRKTVPINTRPKPQPSSATHTKTITSATPTDISVPIPDVVIDSPSLDFGATDDFADKWGAPAHPSANLKALPDAPSFFGQKSRATRIAYVIDYSRSLNEIDGREDLMRGELRKSLSSLPQGTQYQIIFFGGYPWLAGDKIRIRKDGAEVTSGGKTYFWARSGKSIYYKKPEPLPQATWLTTTSNTINKSKLQVRRTELQAGGNWKDALDMAINMDPKPQVIYFITDGGGGTKAQKTAAKFAKKAAPHHIVINTITIMEPRAHELMKTLAEMTNGSFSIVRDKNHIEHVVVQNE